MKNLTWNVITSKVYSSKEDRQTINHTETKLTYIPVERLRTNPRIIVCENEHEGKREKRRQCQSVTDQAEQVSKRVKLEKREDALQRNS